MNKEKCFVWMKVEDLAQYLFNHSEKEVGFTDDIYMGEEIFEPSGWYGIQYTNIFDGWSILIGYYGDGVDSCFDVIDTAEDITDILVNFFMDRLNIDLKERKYICVYADDVKD